MSDGRYCNTTPDANASNLESITSRRQFLQALTATPFISLSTSDHRILQRKSPLTSTQLTQTTHGSTAISEMRPVQTVWDAGPVQPPDSYDNPPEDVVTLVSGKPTAVLSRINWSIPTNSEITQYSLHVTTETDTTRVTPVETDSHETRITTNQAETAAETHETQYKQQNDSTARFTSQVLNVTPPTTQITVSPEVNTTNGVVVDELTLTVTGETKDNETVVIAEETKTIEVVTVPPIEIHVIRQADPEFGTVSVESLRDTRAYLYAYLKRVLPIRPENLRVIAHPEQTFTVNTDWGVLNTVFSEPQHTSGVVADAITAIESTLDRTLLKVYLAGSTLGPVTNMHETVFADSGSVPRNRTYTVGLFSEAFKTDELTRHHPEYFSVSGVTLADRVNTCVGVEKDFMTVVHELGHQFGLYNPTEEYSLDIPPTGHTLNGYDVYDQFFPYDDTDFTGRSFMASGRATTTKASLDGTHPFISASSSPDFSTDIAWISNTKQTPNDQHDYDRLIESLRVNS